MSRRRLESMILMDPFQLGVFYDSMKRNPSNTSVIQINRFSSEASPVRRCITAGCKISIVNFAIITDMF